MRKRLARVRSKRSSLKVTFSVILSILTSRKLYQVRQGDKKESTTTADTDPVRLACDVGLISFC
jgi:hypothetical protein